MQLKAQGATEYLVLLAVVLIVALVSVALLGFFPGMASDTQVQQNEMYWKSMQPIAIVETTVSYWDPDADLVSVQHIRVRNTGAYPIRLTKMLGGSTSISQVYDYSGGSGYVAKNISDVAYLAPGAEVCFGDPHRNCKDKSLFFALPAGYSGAASLRALTSFCDSSGKGVITMPNFGFEYIEYIEGQQITKREVGQKPLLLRCGGLETY